MDTLEAMGFPRQWCEKALQSSSSLETAIDLLLKWQTQGMPGYLPSSVAPSSPTEGQTLRLQPLPSLEDRREPNPDVASVAQTGNNTPPACGIATTGRSRAESGTGRGAGLSTPSFGVEKSHVAVPDAYAEERKVRYAAALRAKKEKDEERARIRQQLEEDMTLRRLRHKAATTSTTGNSSIEIDFTGTGGEAGLSNPSFGVEKSHVVVPDTYAEERNARYAAALRAKKKKQEEKAKIQEDSALRRSRNSQKAPHEIEVTDRTFPVIGQRGESSSSPEVDTAVELQIRCPDSQILKASFTAGATLIDVRAYVEKELQRRTGSLGLQHNHSTLRPRIVPFSGPSARVSSEGQAEREAARELLQSARENFELQTSKILAAAKSLRNTSEGSQNTRGNIYFLIPFPRLEFFTESSLKTTLAEAQLVPRGTLVVQYREGEAAAAPEVDENAESTPMGVDSDRSPAVGVSNIKKGNLSLDGARIETSQGDQMLEMEGERMRARERTLQAASTRMNASKALPITDRENREGFHFPKDAATQNNKSDALSKNSLLQEMTPVVGSAFSPANNESNVLKAAGAGEELGASISTVEHSRRQDSFGSSSPDVSRQEAVPAAERPIRNSQPQVTVDRERNPAALLEEHTPQQVTAPCIVEAERNSSLRIRLEDGSVVQNPFPAQITLQQVLYSVLPESAVASDYGFVVPFPESHFMEGAALSITIEEAGLIPRGILHLRKSTTVGMVRQGKSVRKNRQFWEELEDDEEENMDDEKYLSCDESMEFDENIDDMADGLERNPQSQATTSGYDHMQMMEESSQVPMRAAANRAEVLEAALQRCKEASEDDSKGKSILGEDVPSQVTVPSSLQLEAERSSALRIRLEDGSLLLHETPATSQLQEVLYLILPEGAAASEYGLVIPFPELRFLEGDALSVTLQEAGLVPRGTIYLSKLATRGMVRRGRRASGRHRGRMYPQEYEREHLYNMQNHLRSMGDLSYEDWMELEENNGRVHVSVKEEVIATFPTHTVKAKAETPGGNNVGGEKDMCLVCMEEMVDGEEALSLPCFHMFHTICIRRWLERSTWCPTCKQDIRDSVE